MPPIKNNNLPDHINKFLGWIICGIAFLLYINTVKHSYVLDDFALISDNSVTTKGISAIPEILSHFYRYGYYTIDDGIYRPLSVVMFAIEWSFSPNNPSLSHWVNVLLYILTGFILFKTLVKLLVNYNIILPFIITLLFITHPVHTEVVANIKSRDEILCFLLSISCLYFLLSYINSSKLKYLIIASILLFAALLSKETAITMLVIAPLALYFFTHYKRNQLIYSIAALLLPIALYLIIRSVVLDADAASYKISPLENLLLAAPDLSHRIATAVCILGLYLKLIILPVDLVYDRSFNHIPIVNFTNILVLISLLVYIALFIYAITGIKKKNIISFGILFYLISISLFSNILFTIGVAMADRFLYFSSLGFCIAIAGILLLITKTNYKKVSYGNVSSLYKQNKNLILISISICLLYSIKTISRNRDWKNNYTLYSADIKFLPNNARAHLFLGNEIIKNIAPLENDPNKRFKLNSEGISAINKSLSIYPENPDAWNTIASGYLQVDSIDKAAFYFEKAASANPDDLSNLGGMYFAKGEYDKAINLFEKVLQKNPEYLEAHINLGICYGLVRKYDNAIYSFQKAIAIDNSNAQVYFLLASTYKLMGDDLNYEKFAAEALRRNPNIGRP